MPRPKTRKSRRRARARSFVGSNDLVHEVVTMRAQPGSSTDFPISLLKVLPANRPWKIERMTFNGVAVTDGAIPYSSGALYEMHINLDSGLMNQTSGPRVVGSIPVTSSMRNHPGADWFQPTSQKSDFVPASFLNICQAPSAKVTSPVILGTVRFQIRLGPEDVANKCQNTVQVVTNPTSPTSNSCYKELRDNDPCGSNYQSTHQGFVLVQTNMDVSNE